MSQVKEVFCQYLPLDNLRLLVPNGAIDDVIIPIKPAPLSEAPSWLLGSIPWRDGTIPLLSFEVILGAALPARSSKTRIAIIPAVTPEASFRYLGLLLQGLPQLLKVEPGVLQPVALEPEDKGRPVLTRARIGNSQLIIPDMSGLETMIDQVFGDPSR